MSARTFFEEYDQWIENTTEDVNKRINEALTSHEYAMVVYYHTSLPAVITGGKSPQKTGRSLNSLMKRDRNISHYLLIKGDRNNCICYYHYETEKINNLKKIKIYNTITNKEDPLQMIKV